MASEVQPPAEHTRLGAFIRADAPIEGRSQDRLNRARLADAIADQVIHGPNYQGLVIGIAGKWGSGKTSILKMVEESVGDRSATVVVRFNPWLFSSAEELVTRFLEELGSQLQSKAESGAKGELLRRVGDQLFEYAESVEPFGWLPVLGPWLTRFGSAGRAYRAMLKSRKERPSADQQRHTIRDELRKLDRRVLVVIDDLDRIEPSQIRDMVRLVKLVGDFPNTTYLLAYDPEPVERALGQTPQEGRVYLEKIVQVIHDIPEPPPEALVTLLLEELNTIVDSITTGEFRERDWQNILPDGIRPFFRTPRDVRRYLNAVPVTLRVIGAEVALVDVLALEAIRIFAPGAYAELPASIATLTGANRGFGVSNSAVDEIDAPRINAILEGARPFEEPTKEILRWLFPSIGHHLGGSRMSGHEKEARRNLRVADPNILRTYLERTLPAGVVSGVLVGEAAQALTSREQLTALFGGLEPGLVEPLIQRLEDYEYVFPPEAVEPAVPVLLNQLSRLREGRRGMHDFGADVAVSRVVLRLCRRLEEPVELAATIERILPEVESFTGRMELLDVVGHRENVGAKLLTAEDSARLYESLETQIMAADPAELEQERGLFDLVLRIFQDRADSANEWMRQLISVDAVLLRLLRSRLSEQQSQTMGEYAVRTRMGLPWELLEKWFGGEELRIRVAQVAENVDLAQLDDRTRLALETASKYASGELTNSQDF